MPKPDHYTLAPCCNNCIYCDIEEHDIYCILFKFGMLSEYNICNEYKAQKDE